MSKTMWSNRRLRQGLTLLVVSAFIALIGPFGTFTELSLGLRFLYWLALIVLGWAQWSVLTWALRRLTTSNPWPAGAIGTVVSVVSAVPMALAILWTQGWLEGTREPGFAELYLWVAAVSLLTCWLGYTFMRWARTNSPAADPRPGERQDVRFLRRIPPKIAGELLCVSTEDHYLRVHTANGSDLILFRLKDALGELTGADGMQVHRSFWVARNAVETQEKKGRKTTLILKNGMRVPVSESFLPAAREAGWLD